MICLEIITSQFDLIYSINVSVFTICISNMYLFSIFIPVELGVKLTDIYTECCLISGHPCNSDPWLELNLLRPQHLMTENHQVCKLSNAWLTISFNKHRAYHSWQLVFRNPHEIRTKSGGFHEIKNVSFWVITKYRSFFRKTKKKQNVHFNQIRFKYM